MNANRVEIVKKGIREKVERQGLRPEAAAELVRREYEELGLTNTDDLISAALEQYRADIDRIEFLPLATIPRRRHQHWYGGPTEEGIWAALKLHLLNIVGFGPETVDRIDDSSSKIVSLLDNPGIEEFSTRGLVVGYVQSGKTANMTAVIAKAVDANYRFVIILAGMTDALRNQTQERLETDLIHQNPARWYPLTTTDTDFTANPRAGFPKPAPGACHIGIVKKNASVLRRLIRTVSNTPPQILRDVPFLIIDDECDQASVNAARYRDEMTRINSQIRTLIHKLPRNAYVGYTATPFANVLIDPAVSVDPDHLDDLYPADFITALPQPDNYFGARSLFGRDLLDADPDLEGYEGLDMIRIVEDEETDLLRPQGYLDRTEFRLSITPSLERACRYYLLASAARCARNQADEHSCMLVHTTVYVDPHFDAQRRISELIENLATRIRAPEPALLAELRVQWEDESDRVRAEEFGNDPIAFDELSQYLQEVVSSVEVRVENGLSEERLDFSGDQARRYIVVGGSVLARGLTIKGLVVSFFLRTSSQYDSLMQMGRWFGFRPGYEEMPRVWMTRDMRDAFRDLATVEAEIRNDIAMYGEQDISPLDFAVRIRQIPGMLITARNKMLAAQACDISYASEHIQTRRFRHRDLEWLTHNWKAGAKLIQEAVDACGEAEKVRRGRLIREVPVGSVLRFLQAYRTHERQPELQSQLLLDYIESQNQRGDGYLSKWNIGIIEPASGTESQHELGPAGTVRTVVRSMLWETQEGDADIKALMSRGDILIDAHADRIVGDSNWRQLKAIRQQDRGAVPLLLLYPIEAESKPRESIGAEQRDNPTRASLNAATDVLGIGVVFPDSPVPTPQSYVQVQLPDQEYEVPAEEYEFPELEERAEEEAD